MATVNDITKCLRNNGFTSGGLDHAKHNPELMNNGKIEILVDVFPCIITEHPEKGFINKKVYAVGFLTHQVLK